MKDRINITSIVIETSQESDSCDSEDFQDLTVEFDDAGGGFFLRLKTGKNGWSFDNINDISKTINDILFKALPETLNTFKKD